MKRRFSISAMLAVTMLVMTGCGTFRPPAAKTYTEQVTTTVDIETTVATYEREAQALRTIHDSASALCVSKAIAAKDCTKLDILYQEARAAFIAKGDRYKEYLAKPTPETRLRWLNAATEYSALYTDLKLLAEKNGVEVPK